MDRDTPSNSELYRGISDLKIMFKDHYDIQTKWHEENSVKLSDLNTKVAVQNGRVASTQEGLKVLGDKFVEYCKNNDSRVDLFTKWFWIVSGIIMVVGAFGVTFINLYLDRREQQLKDNIPTAIDEYFRANGYDKIIIDNN